MEGETCQYNKFGYCKFQDKCKRTHFNSECEDLDTCKNIKSCQKRHPKRCKKYASKNCRFNKSCAYNHQKPTPDKDHELLNEKVSVLEKVVHELKQKVLSMELEIEQLKKKNTNAKGTSIEVHEKVIGSKTSEKKCSTGVDKELSEPRKVKDKKKESDSKEEFFNCYIY